MTRHDKLVDAVFGSDKTSSQPEWKQIQEKEQKRRDALRDKLKTERLARDAAATATATATTDAVAKPTTRRRKKG